MVVVVNKIDIVWQNVITILFVSIMGSYNDIYENIVDMANRDIRDYS